MAEPTRRSPIAPLVGSMERASLPGASLGPAPFLAVVELRVEPAAQPRVTRTLGTPLPGANRLGSTALGEVVCIGPDQWMVIGPDGTEAAIAHALRSAVGSEGAVVELSGAYSALLLRGPLVPDVLATCCAVDFHPRAFLPGHSAATLVAKAPALIHRLDDVTYRVLVRSSLAAYVVSWLVDGLEGVDASERHPSRRE